MLNLSASSSKSIPASNLKFPLCRSILYQPYKDRDIDLDLLKAVTKKEWPRMRELKEERENFQAGMYAKCADGRSPNVGMMALHFAVRDHAPVEVIRDVFEGYPSARFEVDAAGLIPEELLENAAQTVMNVREHNI
jgi:hypothetical protein